jgi:uncharacterized membrane protein YbhN (UPF0104 family)
MTAVPTVPGSPASGGTRRWRRVALRLLVSAALIALLLFFVKWRAIEDGLRRVPLATFAFVVAGFLVTHVAGTFKWRMVIGTAGARLTFPEALECYAAGIFSNIFIPGIIGGDVARAVIAGRRSGRMEAAVLGGVADRLLDLLSLVALAVGGGLFVGFRSGAAKSTLVLFVGALALAGVVAAVVLRTPLARWPAKQRRRVAQALVALRRQRRQPGVLLVSFVGACAIQGSLTLLNVPLGRAVGIEAPLSAWFFAWSLSKIASLVGGFNGLGTREVAFTALMVPLVTNGSKTVDELRALAVASSISWQATLLVSSLFAGAAWAWLRRSNVGLVARHA